MDTETQLDEEIPADEDNLMSTAAAGPSKPTSIYTNKKFKMNPVDKHFIEILNKSVAVREKATEKLEEDDDKLFCMSLYKELKKVPEHGRCRAKIQLLEVIQRAQDFYNPLQVSSSTLNSYNQFDYGVNHQLHKRPMQQDGYSGHFDGANQQRNQRPMQQASSTSSSLLTLVEEALSPTDSIASQASSLLSNVYTEI